MSEVVNYTAHLTEEEKKQWFNTACDLWRAARKEGKNLLEPDIYLKAQEHLINKFCKKANG